MSAMGKMLGDMLKREIPPEVMDLLTPEKIKEISEGINAYIVNTRDSLERIEAQNMVILKAIEDLNNGGHNSNSGTLLERAGNS